ncbi:MAG TPA: alpha/beta hydrolase, partial [Xanthobacteraceae bacterium]
TGSPSEDGLIADGLAAYRFATARYSAGRLVLWGESLGSGVAVALAAEHPVGGLILESPFTSAADVAARAYPIMPVRLLMKDKFRSDLRIARVRAPVLVMHGESDGIVPIEFGERLFARISAPKRFVRLRGGHNELDFHGAQEAARAFLAER